MTTDSVSTATCVADKKFAVFYYLFQMKQEKGRTRNSDNNF